MNRPSVFTMAWIAVLVLLVPLLTVGQEVVQPVKVTIKEVVSDQQTLPLDPQIRITPEFSSLNFSLTIEGKRITYVAHNGAWIAARIDGQQHSRLPHAGILSTGSSSR